MTEEIPQLESFRDQLATVDKAGKRNWIYPKKPSGRFYTARNIVSIILLAVLFGTPFIKVNGHPFILLNIIERKFILFGIPFGPHDFFLFVLAMIAVIVSIFLFTAVFGRVFCGWICPQTIFMEMVFRKIEYWIEGDAGRQKRLNSSGWTGEKIFKKGIKYSVFFALAFIISNIFLSYIIGIDELFKIVTDPPEQHLEGLIAILAFSGVFYFVFAYFREQACTIVCPYGRLQGVLLDRDSLVIAYDNLRGEPRGKIKKEVVQHNGDCIDCHLCVDVCPTGIDIRNGIQLECVNCTACIDACDSVMDKVNRPRGLIRYASLNGIEKKTKFRFTPRAVVYTTILFLLTGTISYMLAVREELSINILRTPGMLYQKQPGDKISNLYDLNIVNKTFDKIPVDIKLHNTDGEIKLIGKSIVLEPQGNIDAKFLLLMPGDDLKRMNTPVSIGVYSNNKLLREIKTSFLGPVPKEEKEDEGDDKNEED
ncbi:MAG: cytochrome c oxidase accessory protein CcoG [Ignavibacteriaceae bacterium]